MQKTGREMNQCFGSYLKELREMQGLSLSQVQEMTGISASYLNRIERSVRRAVSLPLLEQIARCYKRPTMEVLSVALNGYCHEYQELPLLTSILYSHNFLIGDSEVSKQCKEYIVETINCIVSSEWTADSRIKDTLMIVNCVDKLKKALEAN